MIGANDYLERIYRHSHNREFAVASTLADTVVTEHGVAELRGLTLSQRAQALLAIAAPAHRATLAQAWDTLRRGL